MESEPLSPESVNWFDSEIPEKSPGNFPTAAAQKCRPVAVAKQDPRTLNNYLRILGYIRNVWKKSHQNTPFYDWNPEAFSRKTGTGGGKRIPVKTLERVFPKFKAWCGEYYFTTVNVGGRWTVRVTQNPYVHQLGGNLVRDRFVLAIRAYVAKAGRAKIDAEFCRKFSEKTHLSVNAVEHAWLSLKKIDGIKHKWRGSGRGRKFVAEVPERWAQICTDRAAAKAARKNENLPTSDPQTSPPVSISFGNDKIQSSGPLRGRFPEESARTASASGLPGGETGREGESETEPGGWEPPGIRPYFGRWFPGRAPLQICNRLVFPENVRRKAAWIAKARLENLHAEFPRVHFAFPHARNFAFQALSFGYQTAAIEAAWRAGLAKSHADSVDAGESRDDPTRWPSAAKIYALVALRAADPRPPEILWAEFFAGDRGGAVSPKRPELAREPRPARRASPTPDETAPSAIVAKLREKIARPRDVAGEAEARAVTPLTLGELRAACQKVGISIATFNGLPWANKKSIIDRALRAREN